MPTKCAMALSNVIKYMLLNYGTLTILHHNVNNIHIVRKCRFFQKQELECMAFLEKSINERISFLSMKELVLAVHKCSHSFSMKIKFKFFY